MLFCANNISKLIEQKQKASTSKINKSTMPFWRKHGVNVYKNDAAIAPPKFIWC